MSTYNCKLAVMSTPSHSDLYKWYNEYHSSCRWHVTVILSDPFSCLQKREWSKDETTNGHFDFGACNRAVKAMAMQSLILRLCETNIYNITKLCFLGTRSKFSIIDHFRYRCSVYAYHVLYSVLSLVQVWPSKDQMTLNNGWDRYCN